MQIKGMELEFNFHEENMNRRTLEAFESVSDDAKKTEGKEASEQIGIICKSIKNAFDYIFGQGTGEKVCGNKNDLTICTDVFSDLVEEKNRQEEELKRKTERLLRAFSNSGNKNELSD